MTPEQSSIDEVLSINSLAVLKDEFDFKEQLPGGKFKQLDFRVTRKEDGADLALLIFASRWLGTVNDSFIIRKIESRGHHLIDDETARVKTYRLAADFVREATLLGRIPRHPNLVRFMGFGIYPRPYLLTEWVEGKRLDLIKRTPQEAVRDIYHVARALSVLHGAREEGTPYPIIHNDVKLGNVRLTSEGYGVLMDLGASQAVRGKGIGRRLGSTRNRAPEAYERKDAEGQDVGCVISPASDIYSLGTVAIAHAFGHYLWNPLSKDDPRYEAQAFERYWAALDHYSDEFNQHDKDIELIKKSGRPQLTDEKRNELEALVEDGAACMSLFLEMVAYDPEKRPTALNVVKRLENLLYHVRYDRTRHESSWDFTPDDRFALALTRDRDARLMRGEASPTHEWREFQLYQLDSVRSFGDLMVMLRDGNHAVKQYALEYVIMPCYPLLNAWQRDYVRSEIENHLCNAIAYPDIPASSTNDNRDQRSTHEVAYDTLREIEEYDAGRSRVGAPRQPKGDP